MFQKLLDGGVYVVSLASWLDVDTGQKGSNPALGARDGIS